MIKAVCETFPEATAQARKDFAIVRNTKEYEPPYWFQDTETGKEYRGIYGCLGWPSKVTDNNDQPPGYAAIIGINKKDDRFRILDEVDSMSPKGLIEKCLLMRQRWGFKIHPSLLPVFIGDHLRFELIVAQVNVGLVVNERDDSEAFIVSPPDDWENPKRFDIYFRQLQYVLSPENLRLNTWQADIIKNRLLLFKRDEPAVLAVGGLIHTLLMRKPWMVSTTPSIFQIPEL